MVEDAGSLEQIFRLNKDARWVFIAPGGNQGDHMIYQGAFKLADRIDLKYRKLTMGRNTVVPEIAPMELIYVHGGGGWNTWWNWTPRMVKRITDKYHKNTVIIGPTTVALQGGYINKWMPPKNTVFIAREKTSYKHMKNNGLNLFIDHDTAFHLERGDKYLSSLLSGERMEPFKLAAVRNDAERPDALPDQINLGDYDLVIDPCLSKSWGPLHVCATEILTNRSHSAILGAILGKKTKMFKGNYHKNKSIYEYSLKQRGVEWID